ncbi:MAG: hypothetical protein HY096_14225 [Nitrospinae bacterium]|nr:hypothetical protein [Nitrospinota bacterium]MBI5749830.1 hypothetical protein [Nitrospinota bacterium]
MFKKIGSLFCALALVSFIAVTIADAADNNNNASGTKVVPKAKVKQLKEKK